VYESASGDKGEIVPYQQEISRQHKALVVFLLDQSFSMEEPLGDSANRKMDELAVAINGWLQNMAIRATGSSGIKDYLDVAVIGYRTDLEANPIVESPFGGSLAGKMLLSICELGANPARIEQRMHRFCDEDTGEEMEAPVETPVWVEAKAEGGTPMCTVLYQAYGIVEQWIKEHPKSFPPVVIHITDGESQDGDPRPYAEAVRDLATEDGHVLLFSCHLSMTSADSFLFPASDEILPDDYAKTLFEMSSVLPEKLCQKALAEGVQLQPGARGCAFNANLVGLIRFLDVVTSSALGL
jgi:hypothetical protein